MPNTPDSDWTKLLDDSFSTLKPLKPGEWTQARVVSISKDTVFLELDGKNEGQLARDEVTDKDGELTVGVGDTVKAFLLKTDGGERIFTTKISGETAGADLLEQAFREGVPVDGLVEREIKGGYEVKLGEFRAFCPYSQMGDRRSETPADSIGKRLSFRIQEFKEDGRRIVVSNRVFHEEARQETLAQLKATLKEGQTVRGTVKSVHDYGAFVDLGGVQALLPISEYDRARVEDLRAVLSAGQEIEARILKIDWAAEKLTLSRKSLQADPWAEAAAKFPEGTKLSGRVARVTTFGAFVALAPGIDGLIHVSEFRNDGKYAGGAEVPVKVGQTLAVQVLSVDAANRRIALKPATSKEEDETAAKYLTGGTDKASSDGDTYNPFAALLKKK
jgi:small subunit ribosomal protein S1